jgi:hypothetical protein
MEAINTETDLEFYTKKNFGHKTTDNLFLKIIYNTLKT